MRPTEILKSEHRVIEQVLHCLEKLADQATRTGRLDLAAGQAILDFLRHFADGCHHRKEECALFPALEARGFDAQRGPTAVMRSEHVLGRAAMQGMSANLEGAAQGNADAVASFVRQARTYVELLRTHILKEDLRLFPMAETVLGEHEQKDVLERFERVEHEDAGAHARYLALAAELAKKLGVPESAAVACPTCCGHAR